MHHDDKTLNDLKFPQGCKRIAVCMYGQYRTGDYLLPYYKEFFKNNYNVEVDFFCSVKLTRSYPNSDIELNNKTSNIDTVWDKDTLHSKLENNILKPKSVNVISPEQEVLLEQPGQLFHGIADSIKLKLTYEIKNNFIYDLVFICRYDVLTHPMKLIDYIIPWYDKLTINDYSKIFSGNRLSNFLVGEYNDHAGYVSSYAGINDLFIWGSSQTADLIMFEIMRLLQQCMNKDNNTITAHDMISDQLDGHNGLSIMLRRSNIGFSKIKPIIKNNKLCFIYGRLGTDVSVRSTLVREFFDLTLDPTQWRTHQIFSEAWAGDHYNRFRAHPGFAKS